VKLTKSNAVETPVKSQPRLLEKIRKEYFTRLKTQDQTKCGI